MMQLFLLPKGGKVGGELAIVVSMNAPFTDYGEVPDENGNVTLRHNGNYKPISA